MGTLDQGSGLRPDEADGADVPLDACSRLFAEFLESHHAQGADPEAFFSAHPQHAEELRRWWRRLVEAGEVGGPPRRPVAGQRLGRFRLAVALGHGAQGTVYRATDDAGRALALKVLSPGLGTGPSAARRLAREAAVVARLDHPGICPVYETGFAEGSAYIAMQLIPGETLAQHIARARTQARPLPVQRTLQLVEGVARALHAAHGHGLVHRDIKPGNIMIGGDGQPVVLDFGLAQIVDADLDLTRSGELVGTPSYMSPEQLTASRIPLDARTDVWSLGVALYEALTLRRPFAAESQEQIYHRILVGPLPDPRQHRPGLGRALCLVLQTALAKDRDLRYQTAADLADDLRRVRLGQPIAARRPPLGVRLTRWARRRPALAGSLSLAALSLLAGTVASLLWFLAADRARAAHARLADVVGLQDALTAEARLPGPLPEHADAYRRWLQQYGYPLRDRLPVHRARLQELRTLAAPYAESDREQDAAGHPAQERLQRSLLAQAALQTELATAAPGLRRDYLQAMSAQTAAVVAELQHAVGLRRTYRFDDPELHYEQQTLAALVQDLDTFTAHDGVLASVERRLQWAETVVHTTVVDRAEAWRATADAVHASARYGNRTLAPQPGLVPLGPDPRSGLQEFAHLRSGSPPVRRPDGQLQITPETGIVFVLIPPGTFLCGAQPDPDLPGHDPDADLDEFTPQQVAMDWFFLARHELTRGQWRRLTGAPPPGEAMASVLRPHPDLHPVTMVPWTECRQVLAREGLTLPTELQWEYAARAGTTTPTWHGTVQSLRGHVNWRDASLVRLEGGRARAAAGDDGHPLSAPVDTFSPNPFGLHHILGNVAEWCQDRYYGRVHADLRFQPLEQASVLPELGRRAVRGGSFHTVWSTMRSAARGGRPETQALPDLGLRPAMAVR